MTRPNYDYKMAFFTYTGTQKKYFCHQERAPRKFCDPRLELIDKTLANSQMAGLSSLSTQKISSNDRFICKGQT